MYDADSLLDAFFGVAAGGYTNLSARWDGDVLLVPLPGVKKSEIQLGASGGVLKLELNSASPFFAGKRNYKFALHVERAGQEISAKLSDGVLRIEFDKSARAPRQIAIED